MAANHAAHAAQLYVATNGNDTWSGTLPSPNAGKTDGPLRTLQRARDRFRLNTSAGRKTISVRGGTHFLPEPLQLLPVDSNLTIQAFRNEKPLLSGGRLIAGWKKSSGNIWTAQVPLATDAEWNLKMLRIGEERPIPARYPNFDAKNPYKGGFSHVVYTGPRIGMFDAAVTSMHTPGDWIEWKLQVPADGEYSVWFRYGADNTPFGNTSMAGRITLQVDAQAAVPVEGLPDTGDWSRFAWGHVARLQLAKGERTLRWTNIKGGGLNFDALALCDDPNWTPQGTELSAPQGKNLMVMQAEAFAAAQGKEMVLPEQTAPFYKNRFEFRAGEIRRYAHPEDAEIHIFPAWGWVNSILYVKNVDYDTRTVHVEENSNASEELRPGNRYFVSNVREELDAPGEWFLDKRTGELSLWPQSANFAQRGVVAARLDRLIDLQGDAAKNQWVENVSIKGLQFADTTYSRNIGVYSPMDAVIWMSGARNCIVEGNRFRNIGGYAARLENVSTRNEFVGNEVAWAGQGGVALSGDVATQPKDNLIAGNWMHHLGQVYKHVAGVYGISARGTRVAHNRFEYLPRYAVSFKGLDNENYSHQNVVEYNDMLWTNLETNDTGAIESLGREKLDTGNIIQYNRILDVVGIRSMPDGKDVSPYMTWGIYLDDYSSGTLVRGNVVARHEWGGVSIHGGKNNTIENNIFIDGAVHQMWYDPIDDFSVNNKFNRNIVVWRAPDAVLYKQTRRPPSQVISASDRNLFWHRRDPSVFQKANVTPLGTLEQWRAAGFDANSLVADPQFENAAKDDYRLKPGSPALKLGFEPIPFGKIGLQGYARSYKRAQK
ncbi:MAG TPA: right-handed parallel beta-helix repeat-containing protein [Abditibacteriaceae bacterium]